MNDVKIVFTNTDRAADFDIVNKRSPKEDSY